MELDRGTIMRGRWQQGGKRSGQEGKVRRIGRRIEKRKMGLRE